MKTYKELLSEMAQDPHKAGYQFHLVSDYIKDKHVVVASHPSAKGLDKFSLGTRLLDQLPDHMKDHVVGTAEIWHSNGEQYGHDYTHWADTPHNLYVNPEHRRKGVASGMYDKYREHTGRSVKPSNTQSDDAVAFWKDRRNPVSESALRLSGNQDGGKADQLLNDLHDQTEEHPLNRAARVTPEGVSLEASKFGRGVHLSSIASSDRGSGHASKALRTLTGLADKHGVPLTLIPQPTDSGGAGKGLSKDQLAGWYGRYGFVKAADGQKMVREPNTTIKLKGFKRQH